MYQHNNHIDMIANEHIESARRNGELARLGSAAKREGRESRMPLVSTMVAAATALISAVALHAPRS